jgi:hypothetical protein
MAPNRLLPPSLPPDAQTQHTPGEIHALVFQIVLQPLLHRLQRLKSPDKRVQQRCRRSKGRDGCGGRLQGRRGEGSEFCQACHAPAPVAKPQAGRLHDSQCPQQPSLPGRRCRTLVAGRLQRVGPVACAPHDVFQLAVRLQRTQGIRGDQS